MMCLGPLVSVIIPAYNEDQCIYAALESVLYQKTKFSLEIIVVDDHSQDRTHEVACAYAARDARVKVLRNERNMGKGYSVRRAYNLARGVYVHILDADDIFSNWDKLQRQVDILQARTDCFAVAHNTLFLRDDNYGKVVPGCAADTVYTYEDCYRHGFYCHTSSYLFRRVKEGLPEYFERNSMRGDTALFFYHAFAWRKSVYILKQVMSVYNIHGKGIWSSLDRQAQDDLNTAVLRDLQALVIIDSESPEFRALESRIEWLNLRPNEATSDSTEIGYVSIDSIALECERIAAKVFRSDVRPIAFQGIYSLPDVDTTMETLGRAVLHRMGFCQADRIYDRNRVVLLVSGFVPNGGGVFREIKEIVHSLVDCGMKIDIISIGRIETDIAIIETHFADPAISYCQLDHTHGSMACVSEALTIIERLAPDRLYPFITHHDVVGLAVMQQGLARELLFDFVYDHGLSLGIHSSSIDRIITKTNSQASALALEIDPSRLVILAPFFTARFVTNPYEPLRNGTLTTASAAARSYKVETDYRYSYFDILAEAMSRINMRHIHYGPISDEAKKNFLDRLSGSGVAVERFVHIPWAPDFGQSLVDEGVDVFISPFPICSARIGIEVLSCGIPTLNHRASFPSLPEAGDFSDPDQPSWSTPEDIFATLTAMDPQRLSELSRSARRHFDLHNDAKVTLRRFTNSDFDSPRFEPYPRFRLSDLALEPFFNEILTKPSDTANIAFPQRVKFWRRTPARRQVRSFLRRLQGKH